MAALPGQQFEIELDGVSIRYREYTSGGTAHWNYYPVINVKCVESVDQIGYGARSSETNQRFHRTRQDDLLRITISFVDDTKPLIFDIQNVMNQAGWTPDSAGVDQALSDINDWIESGMSAGGGSSTSTDALIQQLIDIQSGPVTNEIIAPVLPYTIPADTYRSYTIITSGAVEIDGIAVPTGTVITWDGVGNETGSEKEITTLGGGTVIILTQSKP